MWSDNKEFPYVWQTLMRDVGALLLAYEATDQIINSSFIIDWAHMEQMLGGHSSDRDEHRRVTNENRFAAEKAYWNSKIPLADYIDNPTITLALLCPKL